jgi:hypothetical protein
MAELSATSRIGALSSGFENEGQPVPEWNLSFELKSATPDATLT